MVFGKNNRRSTKSHSQLFRDEMGQTFSHLRQAAAHGAGGVGTTMGPRANAARNAAMTTATGAVAQLMAARKRGERQAGGVGRMAMPSRPGKKREQKMARKRTRRRLMGLLAIGTAVGAASALVGRYKRQAVWQEYDPGQGSSQPAPEATAAAALNPEPVVGISDVDSLAEQARESLGTRDDSAFAEAEFGEADTVSPQVEPSRNRGF